jgi:hypothetical protein
MLLIPITKGALLVYIMFACKRQQNAQGSAGAAVAKGDVGNSSAVWH